LGGPGRLGGGGFAQRGGRRLNHGVQEGEEGLLITQARPRWEIKVGGA